MRTGNLVDQRYSKSVAADTQRQRAASGAREHLARGAMSLLVGQFCR